jgi:NAD(P)-dependent dehydrogenase (short-subunit alcohol dehydrogenase family)
MIFSFFETKDIRTRQDACQAKDTVSETMVAEHLFDIAGRVILVTGAASGLGRSFAATLAARGATLELVDCTAVEVPEASMPDAVAHVADVTDERSIATIVEDIVRRRGRLDAVVNCAGIFRIAPALKLDVDDFRASLDVNVTGAFIVSRVAARAMASSGGRIVHLASVSSLVSNPQYAAYASSKAALAQLVRVLAREWADQGITVNAIGPAMTETGMTGRLLSEQRQREAALSVIPMGRFGTPEDLLGALLLLVSPAGAFITGQTIYVDGGRTLV